MSFISEFESFLQSRNAVYFRFVVGVDEDVAAFDASVVFVDTSVCFLVSEIFETVFARLRHSEA